jgi:hypothetical protein
MKCPHCDKDIDIIMQPDSASYLQGMSKLSSEYKTNRIWQTAESLAENAQFNISSKSRSKEKLLELFKYFLRELMKSEGN